MSDVQTVGVKVNENAPIKQTTVELMITTELACVMLGNDVTMGQRVVGKGNCPGRDCKAEFIESRPRQMKALLDSVEGPQRLVDNYQCTQCGQRFEGWPRRIMVAR